MLVEIEVSDNVGTITLNPVSYTHLDVYKRQLYDQVGRPTSFIVYEM